MATTQLSPDAVLHAGDRDFGNGLLIELHTAMAALDDGHILEVLAVAPSVPEDLAAWCVLTGNALVGPLQVRKGSADIEPDPVPLGTRLWIYSNFDCNLACDYCCAQSSPRAVARRMPVAMARSAVAEFVSDGGREVLITGGEPFLHPELVQLVEAATDHVPVTVLTNAMVFHSGSRRRMLEMLDRQLVTLQISLDSATPELHDRHRGQGSFARARAGIELARSLGFRVRIAATIDTADSDEVGALRELFDAEGIPAADQVIRRVARQGFATIGVALTQNDLHPEPTITVDGVWWHPVGVTDPALKVTSEPLPIWRAIAAIQRTLAATSAERENTRRSFRCA
ncbi:MAG: radical SAM protein [Candidatus Dormibacteraeota bacterium]|uniref:Radical SAM protein n=1 Tax=Candidatus Amunia macphersoniae TaxID=3127014 RepID=A0A934N9I9_9BACT|nr:radical SAM protein [Candidatus Dormibacteraeota bacterium]